jgi:hypothetical protein
MSRTRAADRIGLPNAITVRCQCGKRVALLDFCPSCSDHVDGVFFGPYRHGQPVIADDWRQIVCPTCGRCWEGRNSQLFELVISAKRRGATTATLRDGIVATPSVPAAPTHSRVW